MEPVLFCSDSGAWNFEVATGCLEKLFTPVLRRQITSYNFEWSLQPRVTKP